MRLQLAIKEGAALQVDYGLDFATIVRGCVNLSFFSLDDIPNQKSGCKTVTVRPFQVECNLQAWDVEARLDVLGYRSADLHEAYAFVNHDKLVVEDVPLVVLGMPLEDRFHGLGFYPVFTKVASQVAFEVFLEEKIWTPEVVQFLAVEK